ncbi:MAG: hypothetical protein ACE5E6_08120 [Phycisphaerae bacterium]
MRNMSAASATAPPVQPKWRGVAMRTWRRTVSDAQTCSASATTAWANGSDAVAQYRPLLIRSRSPAAASSTAAAYAAPSRRTNVEIPATMSAVAPSPRPIQSSGIARA